MNSYSKRWECLFPQERFLMQELQSGLFRWHSPSQQEEIRGDLTERETSTAPDLRRTGCKPRPMWILEKGCNPTSISQTSCCDLRFRFLSYTLYLCKM